MYIHIQLYNRQGIYYHARNRAFVGPAPLERVERPSLGRRDRSIGCFVLTPPIRQPADPSNGDGRALEVEIRDSANS
jgi:hypothetical protein